MLLIKTKVRAELWDLHRRKQDIKLVILQLEIKILEKKRIEGGEGIRR